MGIPDKVFKVGDRVIGQGYTGTVLQIPGPDEYLIIDDKGGKRIAESRFLDKLPPRDDPKSAKDVRLK